VLEQDTPSAADKEPAVFLDGSLVRGMAPSQPYTSPSPEPYP